nr:MAG TPA: hypothetical protein [Bacteriophage sp.]
MIAKAAKKPRFEGLFFLYNMLMIVEDWMG